MYAFFFCLLIASVLLIFSGIYRAVSRRLKGKRLAGHHELSERLVNATEETQYLSRARDNHKQITQSYEEIRKSLSPKEKEAYESDIELIRDKAEILAESAWAARAEAHLLDMKRAYSLVAESRLIGWEKACRAKEAFLKAYDQYFECTQRIWEHNRSVWKEIDLQDEAIRVISEMLEEIGLWKGSFHSVEAVRRQIKAALEKRCEEAAGAD